MSVTPTREIFYSCDVFNKNPGARTVIVQLVSPLFFYFLIIDSVSAYRHGHLEDFGRIVHRFDPYPRV